MDGHVKERCCARTEICADCGGAVRTEKRMVSHCPALLMPESYRILCRSSRYMRSLQ